MLHQLKYILIYFVLFLIPLGASGQVYTLAVYTTNDAPEYGIQISPSGNWAEGVRTYQKGTLITLNATSNPVYTFDHWNDGDTSRVKPFSISNNVNLVAHYKAKDFIAAWDLYAPGNANRAPDFSFLNENADAVLELLDENGNASAWASYSSTNENTWFGKYAAMIRRSKSQAGKYFFQIKFNSKKFENIRINASMLEVYTHYKTQLVEYSLDGTTFTTIGKIDFVNDSTWYSDSFPLPADANKKDSVFVRFKADQNAQLVTNGNFTGTSISDIYVMADYFNDGIAPSLLSSSPTNEEKNVQKNGKIRLTFSEQIRLTETPKATLNNQPIIEIYLSGHFIEFPFTDLDYATEYTFTFPANQLFDANSNPYNQPIVITFTTMEKPVVQKKVFDFIVGVDGDFKEALAAAQNRSSQSQRFYIYFPNGEYNIGELTGDANQMTTISIPNVSYIGESKDGVILYNKSINESSSSTATIQFKSSSSNIYMQDITLLNKLDYRSGELIGRAVALRDDGKKNIYKNVKLLSNQDTYYTGSDRTYMETCNIHGTTDFIFGGGDVFFNRCLIFLEDKSGPVITAPATNGLWGYVFMNCTIDGFEKTNNGYNLGRPWSNSPKSVYINTTMKKLPTPGAWGNPMNVVPSVFAEYNSMLPSGFPVDVSQRRTTYTKNDKTVVLDPVLSSEDAARYTLKNVLGGSDNWQPNLYTAQIPAPLVWLENGQLQWDNNSEVLCWAVFKNGIFQTFTVENTFSIPENATDQDLFTVRAANAMGGLGEASVGYNKPTATKTLKSNRIVVEKQYFSLEGKQLIRPKRGVNIIVLKYQDGTSEVKKVFMPYANFS